MTPRTLSPSTIRELDRLHERDRTQTADYLAGELPKGGLVSGSTCEEALLDIMRLFTTQDISNLRAEAYSLRTKLRVYDPRTPDNGLHELWDSLADRIEALTGGRRDG